MGPSGLYSPPRPSFNLHELSVTQGPAILLPCEDGGFRFLVRGPKARANACSCPGPLGWSGEG